MPIIKLTGFSGELPSIIPRVLPNMAAQQTFNNRLNDGGLTPFRKPKLVEPLSPPVGDGYLAFRRDGENWQTWESRVHALPGPVAQDRLYLTGDGAPKMIVANTQYDLAAPAPTAALTAVVSGASTSSLGSTRLYVTTFVTGFGEESEPSPISEGVYWEPGQTVTLSGFESPPAGRNITKQRIYRSQTSLTGTSLYFIAERDADNIDFVDDVPSDQQNELLPSLDWTPPVAGLSGLIALPNGLMAAFDGRDLYFCEPFRPHAWPVKYMLTVDYPIVGLGAFGGSVVVLTEGNPYVINGSHPESMVMEKLELNLPCLSAAGIQDLGYAVAYPSHDGLVLVSSAGARIATELVVSREDWRALNPNTMVGGQLDGRYFASYQYTDPLQGLVRSTLVIDTTGEQPFVIRIDIGPEAFYYDLSEGDLYYLQGNNIFQWDAAGQPHMVQSWRSKQFVMPRPTNFGAIRIDADDALSDDEIDILDQRITDVKALNAGLAGSVHLGEINTAALNVFELNGSEMQAIPLPAYSANVNVYADGKMIGNANRVNRTVRLPAGFLARLWELEVSGDLVVSEVMMAQTANELAGG